MNSIRTVDAHVAGSAVRLIVEGFPSPRGKTMVEKLRSASRQADDIRRVTMLEPRGHVDMCGAVLTEPVTPDADAGLLFMDSSGFRALSGHGVMAVARIALSRGLLMPRDDDRVVFDTAAGTVRVRISSGDEPSSIWWSGVPSFVFQPGVDLSLPGRRLRADVAYGGGFYAIVDAESAGVSADGSHLEELRRIGVALAAAVDATLDLVHPLERMPMPMPLSGVILTAPPRATDAALRSAVVRADGAVERSPSGTGTAAMLTVLDDMGLLAAGGPFVHEGLSGETFAATIARRTRLGAFDALIPEIAGRAYVTGEHLFEVSSGDPLGSGFRLS